MSDALTTTEAATLTAYEAAIDRNIDAAAEVFTALTQIRVNKLYRGTHDDFATYCRERFSKFTKRHINRLIAATEVAEAVDPTGTIGLTVEAHARELARLPESEQGEAWAEACEATNGKPTAKDVREVVASRLSATASDEDEPPEPEESGGDVESLSPCSDDDGLNSRARRDAASGAGQLSNVAPMWRQTLDELAAIIARIEKHAQVCYESASAIATLKIGGKELDYYIRNVEEA